MKRIQILLLCAIMMIGSNTYAASFNDLGDQGMISDPGQWGAVNTHDPSIVRDGDTWYVFSTDASYGNMHKCGVQVRASEDLIHWDYLGTAFEDYANDCAEAIAAAGMDTDAHDGLWAPDAVKTGDTWRMYYSASTFGSSRSAIAMAESGSPLGPWTDKGIVIKSDANAVNGPNAIDPCIFTDTDGSQYMTYGSFFGGIFLTGLDEDGFAKGTPVRIAGFRGCRAEGSYLIYLPQTEYYYLFLSYGSLTSDYNIRVGRSKTVEGPYTDANGMKLTDLVASNENRIGVKLMGGYHLKHTPGKGFSKGVKAPGHCSVYADGDVMYLVHHARTGTLPDYWFGMQVRPMMLSEDGWPLVMPMSYQGEDLTLSDKIPEGEYYLVCHGTESNAEPVSSQRVLLKDGMIEERGSYETDGDGRIRFTIDEETYDGVCLWQHDDEREGWVMSISGISETGSCVWLSEETLHEQKGDQE
ncbi:MAG: arabinan endo-1,5-alpha-L-arabinosidase [Parasporobacterium sp.]|nr:arabinan endo-1,5-alpha-L-arabinosidase [Parasporobacterium sp.]